ncbi:hypothetical protein EGW08_006473 [Elysia chlorotica]|uniref:Lipoxygenase domain-containing protein n=1 Tax=Elysia chlorotica TaxID=188477 RepID=A0A433TW33_ELYCH|nr:hypothetical protein EGW08_006473 [Elysia chlorotica]
MGCLFSKPSSDFMIYVQTGDRRNAGTDANVKLVMHDEQGNASGAITLDNYFKNDFERGCLDTFHVPAAKIRDLPRSGKIARLEVWKDDAWVASDWFVDKIVVENRVTNSTFVFPIFRWIKAKYHYQIRHLDTSLPQFEEYPAQRAMELREKRDAYQFDQKVANGPAQVKSMPSDEQFSFDYKWDIVSLKAKLIATSLLVKLMAHGEWDSLATLTDVYTESTFHKPRGADRWSNDLYFGLQRVASLNHSLIQLCTAIPDSLSCLMFNVGGDTTKTLRHALSYHFPYHLQLCIPIGLFFLDKTKHLRPVAIQLFQKPGPGNPIFTPLCKSLTWALVKMWYNNADAAYHQALTHLGMTHLLMEGVTVATHRNLSQSHPIFKLLAPHFLYLIAINSTIPHFYFFTTCVFVSFTSLICFRFNTWRMDREGTLPNDLKNRGLDDLNVLPCYHFRNDAILLYEAISKYVKAYVSLYYSKYQDLSIQTAPYTPQDLVSSAPIQIFSFIFVCRLECKDWCFSDIQERDILESLPDRPTTLDIMIVTKILSAKGTKSIGDFEVQYIFDPQARDIVDEFRKDLLKISKKIKDRNLHRNPPYEYLDPDIIPNSISI